MNRPILSPRYGSNVVPIRREPAHRILIAPEPFGHGYDVTVCPPPDGIGHDRELASYREARAYAEGLSFAMGWAIVDHGGDEAA